MAWCIECRRSFVDDRALQQHYNASPRHQTYDSSDESSDDGYWDNSSYSSSNNDDDDDSQAYCNTCERWFVSIDSLNQHLAKSSAHNYCFTCGKDFSMPDDLTRHLNSPVHRPKDMKCPMCDRQFKTTSAVCMHVESGGCANCKLSRQAIAKLIRTWEAGNGVQNGITTKRIGWHKEPVHGRPAKATEAAWNGYGYECYLCTKEFNTLNGMLLLRRTFLS
ncbi:hypothetical protein HDV05_005302 [Chytridiales sp. JEL 0842]|nr:hypothetical protein HDV05_005302 [Chytridiales sp. JEL 0842]